MTALPIWDESRSDFPPYVDREKLDRVLAKLTDNGRSEFARAVREAEADEGADAVRDVVDAWQRTALCLDRPGFLQRLADAQEALVTGQPLTDEEMAEIRRIAEAYPAQ